MSRLRWLMAICVGWEVVIRWDGKVVIIYSHLLPVS